MKYAFKVQYIGKNYAGSQIQPNQNLPTIQEELEKALSTLIKRHSADKRPVKTIFSGRTDKGVNSLGQVVHFEVDKPIVASKFVYHLNEILPDDISVTDLKEVDPKFFLLKNQQKNAIMCMNLLTASAETHLTAI